MPPQPRKFPLLTSNLVGHTLCGAILGPWRLYGLIRYLYPRLREELPDCPMHTNMPLLWWAVWIALSVSGVLPEEAHTTAAAILYILCGWAQTLICIFVCTLYPEGFSEVRPTYRHYKLSEWLDVWLPSMIALALLLLATGCSLSTCMGGASLVAVLALCLNRPSQNNRS